MAQRRLVLLPLVGVLMEQTEALAARTRVLLEALARAEQVLWAEVWPAVQRAGVMLVRFAELALGQRQLSFVLGAVLVVATVCRP